jgi:hypothetical protein
VLSVSLYAAILYIEIVTKFSAIRSYVYRSLLVKIDHVKGAVQCLAKSASLLSPLGFGLRHTLDRE